MAVNKRRLRFALSVVLTVAVVTYAAFGYVPAYKAFAGDFRGRWLWTSRGFDDPEVRRKAYEGCMEDLRSRWPGHSDAEDRQYDDVCSGPGWIGGEPVPSWWDATVAYLKSVGAPKVAYVIGAIILGPWLFAFLAVTVVPAVMARIWQWLRTSDGGGPKQL
jgi:hypothetical protein